MDRLPRAALMIDADNLTQVQVADAIEKLEKICNPIIRKAFGDFRNAAKNWEVDFLSRSGIAQVQHSPIAKHKNGADIAMCIATMEVLHKRTDLNIRAIVLFSSDSDFGALATKIRETGVEVIGIGGKNTNDMFKNCFDRFIIVETPVIAGGISVKPPRAMLKQKVKPAKKPAIKQKVPDAVRNGIIDVLTKVQGSNEPVLVSKISVRVKNHISGFTPKKYGFASISKLLNSMSEVVLSNGNKSVSLVKTPEVPIKPSAKMSFQPPSKAVPIILRAIKNIKTDDEWYRLAAIRSQLFNNEPEFNYRDYGCDKLGDLLKRTGQFEVDSSGTQDRVRRIPQTNKKATK